MIEETIFNHHNAKGATVSDVDTMQIFDDVMIVNTAEGWIEIIDPPLRVDHEDKIVVQRIHFRAIHAIRGGDIYPRLFHCYGRLPDAR